MYRLFRDKSGNKLYFSFLFKVYIFMFLHFCDNKKLRMNIIKVQSYRFFVEANAKNYKGTVAKIQTKLL